MGNQITKEEKAEAQKKAANNNRASAPIKKNAKGEVVKQTAPADVEPKSKGSIFSCGAGKTAENTNAQKAKMGKYFINVNTYFLEQRNRKTEKGFDKILEDALQK